MEIKYSVCPHDCPDACGWEVQLDQGKVIKVTGDTRHPVTQGIICEKARFYPQRVYGEDRVLYPMRRVGAKGSGQFERISWEQAFTEISQRWQDLLGRYGGESILPYSYAGTMGIINKSSMDRRFFNRLGASILERTICSAAGVAGYGTVYGEAKGVNPLDTVNAKLIIFWGINVLDTNFHQAILADKARKQGARIVVIDVHRNRSAEWADDFYQVLPGSDGALALGLAHVILRDKLTVNPWTGEHVHGLAEFAETAKTYTPERVAKLTGLSVERIEELAHLYGETKPSFIRIGNGFQHHDNGGTATRAVASLPALVGAWSELGGGALKSNSGYFPLNQKALNGEDLIQGSPRTINMMQLGKALTDSQQPVYSLYVYNSNPAVITPEQSLIRQGLAREDLFTVVHEQVWNETARWADIVLPATTHLEHQDLYLSYWHCTLLWAEPVIKPLGEAKPNIEVFQELSRYMGFQEECLRESAEDLARQALELPYWHEQDITFDRLKQERFIPLPKAIGKPFAEGKFKTPSTKVELASKAAAGKGLPFVPEHKPLVEGPEASGQYPLTLICTANRWFLNSTFSNIPELKKKAGEPKIELNTLDAAARGIADGDLVEVFNDRGVCVLKAVTGEAVLQGVAVTMGLWEPNEHVGGFGVNALTPGRLTDMGRCSAMFSNLVEIRKVSDRGEQECEK